MVGASNLPQQGQRVRGYLSFPYDSLLPTRWHSPNCIFISVYNFFFFFLLLAGLEVTGNLSLSVLSAGVTGVKHYAQLVLGNFIPSTI